MKRNNTKRRLILGAALASIIGAGVFTVCADSFSKTIDVFTGVHVFVNDNTLDAGDTHGNPEAFIYNGTTYIAAAAVSKSLGQSVQWDGNTRSVYIGSHNTGNSSTHYLMQECPPYETPRSDYDVFPNSDTTFKMGGQDFGNGFCLGGTDASVLFNLNGQYSNIDMYVGHWDGLSSDTKTAYFYVDGKLIKEMEVGSKDLPKKISLPVNGGLQLEINIKGSYSFNNLGFGEITVR